MKLYLETNDVIINDGVKYGVVYYSEKMTCNVAILKREGYCPYVVAHNISKDPDGTYSWRWGHYFHTLESAYSKYEEIYNKYIR